MTEPKHLSSIICGGAAAPLGDKNCKITIEKRGRNMYIEKYWGNYIGGTDDSLTLLDYFMDQQKCEIALKDIFTDTGLDRLNWDRCV